VNRTRSSKVEVRQATQADVDQLEKEIPSGRSRFHHRRFDRQEDGSSSYLIAWRDGRPVGNLLLKWQGPDEEIVHRHLSDVPELNAIGVKEDLRGQGIGTALIEEAEELARKRGYETVGLAVGTENEAAYRLYLRLGYNDWAHGTFMTEWAEIGPAGHERVESEEVIYLTKELR
jgi:GNAT superfamily N-acetyltransferase